MLRQMMMVILVIAATAPRIFAAGRTSLLSEDFKTNAALNSTTPGGLGTVQSPFAVTREIRGAATSGPGFSGLVNSTGTALYNCNLNGAQPSLEIIACLNFSKFDSAADGNTAELNGIFSSQTASGTGLPSGGTFGVGMLCVRGDGLAELATNATTASTGITMTEKNNYWYIFEAIPYVNGYQLYNVWEAAASGTSQAGNSMVLVASNYCTSQSGTDFNGYAGVRSVAENGGNGATFRMTAYRMASKTCTIQPQANVHTTSGSPIITSIASTTGMQVGDSVGLAGLPLGTTIASVDSSSQIHISVNAISTSTTAWLTVYRGTEVPSLPSVNNPPAGALTVYCRSDAAGGGDGSSNDAAHALTWHEACTYSQASVLGLTEAWTYFGGAIDPKTTTAVAMYNDPTHFAWAGDTILLGTDIKISSLTDVIASPVGIASSDLTVRRNITGLQTLSGPFTQSTTVNGVGRYDPPRMRCEWTIDGKMMAGTDSVQAATGDAVYIIKGPDGQDGNIIYDTDDLGSFLLADLNT